jgi:hypothetical protein
VIKDWLGSQLPSRHKSFHSSWACLHLSFLEVNALPSETRVREGPLPLGTCQRSSWVGPQESVEGLKPSLSQEMEVYWHSGVLSKVSGSEGVLAAMLPSISQSTQDCFSFLMWTTLLNLY